MTASPTHANIRRILLPTDFSNVATSALAYASQLARTHQAELLIVHVEEPQETYAVGAEFAGPADDLRNALRSRLTQTQPTAPNVPVRHAYLTDNVKPAQAILDLAQKEQVDLIVMGTHGRTGLRHLLMGSVAESVTRRAPCAVLTLTQKGEVR